MIFKKKHQQNDFNFPGCNDAFMLCYMLLLGMDAAGYMFCLLEAWSPHTGLNNSYR